MQDIEDAGFNVSIVHSGNSGKNYTVQYTTNNWENIYEENVSISSHDSINNFISLSGLSNGVYNFKARIVSGGEVLDDKETELVILKLNERQYLDDYSRYGTNIHMDFRDYTDGYMDILSALGFPKVRAFPRWNSIEKAEGIYAVDNSRVQPYLGKLLENNMKFSFLGAGFGNELYSYSYIADGNKYIYPPSTQAAIDAYCNYVTNMESLYPIGADKIELWNEPNLEPFWRPESDILRYSMLMNKAAFKLRKSGSSAIITGGALAAGSSSGQISVGDSLNILYGNGLMKYVDEYSVHPYMYPKNPDTGYNYKGDQIGEAKYALSYTDNLTTRYLAKARNAGGWIDVSISEVGWPTHIFNQTQTTEDYGDNGYNGTSEYDQAVYSVKAFIYGDYLGISSTNLYVDRNTGNDINYNEHNFGFLRYDNKLKPAAVSLAQLNSINCNAQFIGRVQLGTQTYGYVYEKLGIPHMIAWTTTMNRLAPNDFEYTLPDGVYVENMNGDSIVSNNTITIGTEPVYIFNIPDSMVLEAVSDYKDNIFGTKAVTFEGFDSYSEPLIANNFDVLEALPDSSSNWREYVDSIYSLGESLISEYNSDGSLMTREAFMENLFRYCVAPRIPYECNVFF